MKYRPYLAAIAIIAATAGCTDDDFEPPTNRNNGDENNGVIDMSTTEDMAPDMAEEEDLPSGPPRINIEVDSITFEDVRIGQTKEIEVGIGNLGEGDLVLNAVEVGEINRQGESEFKPGSDWVSQSTILEPGTFRTIRVLYEPTDEEADRGLVTIRSTDPERPLIEVPVYALNPYPDIDVEQLLKFGSVDADTTETRTMYIYNRGGDPLQINNIVKTGTGPFTLNFLASQQPFPQIIQKGEAFQVDVAFAPTDTDVERATITVTSNDADEGSLDIAVNGNDPTACISLTPRVADFGEVVAGVAQRRTMTIFNCSNVLSLDVSDIEITDDAGGVFAVENLPVLPLTLSGYTTATFDVVATPVEGERLGELTITNNDDSQSPLNVELRTRTAAQ